MIYCGFIRNLIGVAIKKYVVEIHEDNKVHSQMMEWIKELDSHSTKENRTNFKKLYYQIERLKYDGNFVGNTIVKQINVKLWELR